MNANVLKISTRIADLEGGFAEKRREFSYTIEKGRIAFECEMCALHDKLRKHWVKFLWDAPLLTLVVAPVIYSLIVPLVLLDAWLWLYQAVCFPVYGIDKVERSQYVFLDRGHLQYLNWIERINCDYCGYANGLIAYAREVSSRSEQYFCPIKHARRCAGAHTRYDGFLDHGDGDGYRKNRERLRAELRSEK